MKEVLLFLSTQFLKNYKSLLNFTTTGRHLSFQGLNSLFLFCVPLDCEIVPVPPPPSQNSRLADTPLIPNAPVRFVCGLIDLTRQCVRWELVHVRTIGVV